MKKTEIYILSGFLGSGKTTLLKRLLEDERTLGRKVAVMMNELGKISIDSNAVEEDVSLKELLGGCICCSLQDKLEAQLQGLLVLEKPDVIYIETTGAAHPVEVLDAILSPIFANQLAVKGIITAVDGQRWLDRKNLPPQLHQLVLEQVRHADLLIINKTDELTDSQQATITFEIQALNSHAPCLLTTHSNVSLHYVRKLQLSHLKDGAKEGHPKNLHLSTFVYQFKNEIKQDDFMTFLQQIPETIYRIKGYIRFDSGYPYLFQFSYGMPQMIKEYMNMPLNLVFIGEDVNWKDIQDQLESLERS